MSAASLKNKEMHLTNDAIQNKASGYSKYEPGNKLSYKQFETYLAAHGHAGGLEGRIVPRYVLNSRFPVPLIT